MCNVISRLSSLTAVDALRKLRGELFTDTDISDILRAFEDNHFSESFCFGLKLRRGKTFYENVVTNIFWIENKNFHWNLNHLKRAFSIYIFFHDIYHKIQDFVKNDQKLKKETFDFSWDLLWKTEKNWRENNLKFSSFIQSKNLMSTFLKKILPWL